MYGYKFNAEKCRQKYIVNYVTINAVKDVSMKCIFVSKLKKDTKDTLKIQKNARAQYMLKLSFPSVTIII